MTDGVDHRRRGQRDNHRRIRNRGEGDRADTTSAASTAGIWRRVVDQARPSPPAFALRHHSDGPGVRLWVVQARVGKAGLVDGWVPVVPLVFGWLLERVRVEELQMSTGLETPAQRDPAAALVRPRRRTAGRPGWSTPAARPLPGAGPTRAWSSARGGVGTPAPGCAHRSGPPATGSHGPGRSMSPAPGSPGTRTADGQRSPPAGSPRSARTPDPAHTPAGTARPGPRRPPTPALLDTHLGVSGHVLEHAARHRAHPGQLGHRRRLRTDGRVRR